MNKQKFYISNSSMTFTECIELDPKMLTRDFFKQAYSHARINAKLTRYGVIRQHFLSVYPFTTRKDHFKVWRAVKIAMMARKTKF